MSNPTLHGIRCAGVRMDLLKIGPVAALVLSGIAVCLLALAPLGWRLGLWQYRFGLYWIMPVSGLVAAVALILSVPTDIDNPPTFSAVLAARTAEGANSVDDRGPQLAQLQKDAYPDVVPITTRLPVTMAFNEALDEQRAHSLTIRTNGRGHRAYRG